VAAAGDGPATPAAGHPPVLVLCLGNALRRDDAVALHVARALQAAPPPGATVATSARAGLYLLDDMEGYDRVVVVDAVQTGGHPPGTVHALPLEALHAPAGPSPHAIGLPSALALARASGAPVPSRIWLVLVEAAELETVGEGLTPAVAAAVPEAVEAVREAWREVAGG
jgi:hydrogenase maturation protease